MQVSQTNISIDKNEVLRYLGYNNQNLSEHTIAQIDCLISKCMSLNCLKYTYRYFETESVNNEIHLKNTNVSFKGTDIYTHLAGSKYIALFAVTSGIAIESELAKLQKTSMTDAVIFDACANAYIEAGADFADNLIRNEAKQKGFSANYRYSPGYGDFPLECQKDIINLLDCPKKIGLTVTDSMLMIPHKSITAVVGVFEEKANQSKRSCQGCNMYNQCIFRKGGNHCGKNN